MIQVVVSIVVSILLYFLSRASKERVIPVADGRYELRMNKIYKVIGLSGIILGVICLLVPVLVGEYTLDIFIISGFLFLLFTGLSTPCFLWYRNHRVGFDDESIASRNVYGREIVISWSSIKSAGFKPIAGVMALSDEESNTIKVHYHLVGFSAFMEVLAVQRNKYNFECGRLPPNLEA